MMFLLKKGRGEVVDARVYQQWGGHAMFHNFPLMYLVIQEMSNCDTIAAAGDYYRHLTAQGVFISSGQSHRADFGVTREGLRWIGSNGPVEIGCGP